MAAFDCLFLLATASLLAVPAAAGGSLSVAQQNALIARYCAVCHDDAHQNGGLSLQHFDAAQPDPPLAAMLASKLKTGAIGAAGIPRPDQSTIDAWIRATSDQAAGASTWTVKQRPVVTASIIQEVPSRLKDAIVPDLYRLTLTCNAETGQAAMQLAWSPATPEAGREMSASVDGNPLLTYKVTGSEKMGNGDAGASGPGAVYLYGTKSSLLPSVLPLPAQNLTVSNLFPGETVSFPFSALPPGARQALSTCFADRAASR